MGQSQSIQGKISDAQKNIEGLHNDVNRLNQLIIQEVIKLEQDIANAKYTDLNDLCDQIGYQYVDRLSAHFPVTTLEGYGRIKLGLEAKPVTDSMENYKQSVCKNIVAFYKKKLFLLEQIRKETPKCQEQEKMVYQDLSSKLRQEGIDTAQWMDVYKKVQGFNKDIKYQYSKISNSVNKIREAQTWAQLNAASKDTIDLLTNTNNICTRYQADLNRFAQAVSAPEVVNEAPAPPVAEVAPVAEVTPEVAPVVEAPKTVVEQNVPAPVVEAPKTAGPVPEGSKAVLKMDYSSPKAKTLKLKKGDVVTVIKYYLPDWVKVRTETGEEGFIGAITLEPYIKME